MSTNSSGKRISRADDSCPLVCHMTRTGQMFTCEKDSLCPHEKAEGQVRYQLELKFETPIDVV